MTADVVRPERVEPVVLQARTDAEVAAYWQGVQAGTAAVCRLLTVLHAQGFLTAYARRRLLEAIEAFSADAPKGQS